MKKSFLAFMAAASLLPLLSAAELKAPWNGRIELKGNGKFKCAEAVLPLEQGKAYQLDFLIRKVAPLSAKPIEHRLVLFHDVNGKVKEITNFATQVPVDGKTYHFSAAFKIPENLGSGKLKLFLYNCNGTGEVLLKEIKLVSIDNPKTLTFGAAKVTRVEKTAVPAGNAAKNEIIPQLGPAGEAVLFGNKQFLFYQKQIPLERGIAYKVELMMSKKPALSKNPAEHRAVISRKDPSNHIFELAYLGENVPVDGKWHKCETTVTIPDAAGDIMFYIYNCNATGVLSVKDLKFTRLGKIMPWGTGNTFLLKGNGKFLGKNFPIDLPAGKTCTITIEMKKTAPVSKNPAEHRAVLSYTNSNGKYKEILYLGDKVPADGKWHKVTSSLIVPADCKGTAKLNLYNCNALGSLEIKNFQITVVK
ncbi:MAG: hypothetical protein IJW05_04025 [Lentisphaeria bacterium]|nr:hypothetical protein [Lentisphaeria bacterium]